MESVVRCRDCGAPGIETPEDLMPAMCPACFERRVRPIFLTARTIVELIDGLTAVGCVRERVARHIAVQLAQFP